ncbi:MAG TPA: glycosyltransferase family 39 protein [Chthoniobacterales bacterium]|nr:glycosyltransferase family 39 protein [Chthoniobacterales bacterium]
MSEASHRKSMIAAMLLIVCVISWLSLEMPHGLFTNTDELLTAERTREMLLLGRAPVHINFEPSFEKPPLQYWLSTLTLGKITNPQVALRIWPLLFGTLTILGLGWLAHLVDPAKTWLVFVSIALFVSCPLFLTEASRCLLDSGLMLFTTAAIIFSQLARKNPAWWTAVAVACWLGALQKIPLGYLFWILILVARLTSSQERRRLRNGWLAAAIALGIVLFAIWPAVQLVKFHCSIADAIGVRELPVLTGPERLLRRRFLEVPIQMIAQWPFGIFAMIAPVALLASKQWRSRAIVRELSILSLGVLILALISNFRSIRYMLPITPLLSLLLAIALLWLLEQKRKFARLIVLVTIGFFVASVIEAAIMIHVRRRDAADQLAIACRIGELQQPDIPIYVIRSTTGEIGYQPFYLFYGNLRFPVSRFWTSELPQAKLAVPSIGVCTADDLPLLERKIGNVKVDLQQGNIVCWRASND